MSKQYYLNQLEPVLNDPEPFFILVVKSTDRTLKSHNLTLPKRILKKVFAEIKNDKSGYFEV